MWAKKATLTWPAGCDSEAKPWKTWSRNYSAITSQAGSSKGQKKSGGTTTRTGARG